MTTFSLTSKSSTTFSLSQNKSSTTFSIPAKSITVGLWNILTFPWLEALPWQFAAEGAISWSNTTKS